MLFIIIVLYNKKINDDYFFYNFIKELKCTIIFVDNSTDEEIIRFNTKANIHYNIYLSSKGNIGLSKAYNLAIKYIKNSVGLNEDIWVMTVDDDTKISEEYLLSVSKKMIENDIDIFSGIVKDQHGQVLSPIKSFSLKKNYIKNEGNYSNIYCINSGVVIRSTIFNYINYDDDLFLDMIDYKFFSDLSKINKNRIYILNENIQQSFSGKDYNNYIRTKKRFDIFKKDFVTYCKKTGVNFFVKNIFLLKREISIFFHFWFREKRRNKNEKYIKKI